MATKKDYLAIAKVINDLTNNEGDIDRDDLVELLSDYFKEDNPDFNRDLFYKACYGKGEVMAGEMVSINPVTGIDSNGEEHYFHYAIAKALGGKIMPFDKYRGPYVLIGSNKLWLVPNKDFPEIACHWYNESNGKTSTAFIDGKSKGKLWLAIDAAKEVTKR